MEPLNWIRNVSAKRLNDRLLLPAPGPETGGEECHCVF